MRELPIIYSKAMVLAKMAGRKTMTRRTVGLELSRERIDRFLEGAEKRIRRERRQAKHSSNEDFIVKRLENISRLKIIRDEVASLREQL